MFELFTGIYSEKIESGHYRIFNEAESINVFVSIKRCMRFKEAARFIRNIAKQLSDIQEETLQENNLGGESNETK